MSEGMIDLGYDIGYEIEPPLRAGFGLSRGGLGVDVGDKLDDLGVVVVPQWVVEEIPQRGLISVYDGLETIVVDEPPIAVCPDSSTAILWFRPTRLALTDFALTVRREARPDGSVAITGGSAVFSLSVYAGEPARVVHERWEWLEVVALPEAGVLDYAILPATQYGLTTSLELPAGVASAPPIITVSPLGGAATIAVELTESAVLTWRSAIEHGAGNSIPGTVRASTSVPTVDPATFFPGSETHTLDTPLGTLLAGRGPADIHQIDPQQTVAATVVVIGSQLVGATTVALRPSGARGTP